MTAEQLFVLYKQWKRERDDFEDNQELLDVENSPADQLHYEILLKSRKARFDVFDSAYKSSSKEEQEAFRKLANVQVNLKKTRSV
jgi:hypothetical protein